MGCTSDPRAQEVDAGGWQVPSRLCVWPGAADRVSPFPSRWAFLELGTNGSYNDSLQAYAAGVVEASVSEEVRPRWGSQPPPPAQPACSPRALGASRCTVCPLSWPPSSWTGRAHALKKSHQPCLPHSQNTQTKTCLWPHCRSPRPRPLPSSTPAAPAPLGVAALLSLSHSSVRTDVWVYAQEQVPAQS